jgi:hypothetical protein
MHGAEVLTRFLRAHAYSRSMPTSLLLFALGLPGAGLAPTSAASSGLTNPVEGLVTGAMMVAFYAFGEATRTRARLSRVISSAAWRRRC